MEIDVITLVDLIKKLPDPNTFNGKVYLMPLLYYNVLGDLLAFKMMDFDDGSKRWVLNVNN